MYRFLSSIPMVSRRCLRLSEPRVAMERACVSPRVKSPLPWVRGSTPTSQVMGRISSKPRPSRRTPRPTTLLRTWLLRCALELFAHLRGVEAGRIDPATTLFFTSATAASRSALRPGLKSTESSRSPAASATASASSCGAGSGSVTANLGFAADRISSSWRSMVSPFTIWGHLHALDHDLLGDLVSARLPPLRRPRGCPPPSGPAHSPAAPGRWGWPPACHR